MVPSTSATPATWSAQLPNGEVRSGTLEQLDEALRAGHLDAATPVRASASDAWARLADVLAAAPWQVRLADGQIRSGTREQLEEALRAGHLNDEMLVLAGGASTWVKLGSLLGRSLAPPAVAPRPASVVPAAVPVASARPVLAALAPSTAPVAPASRR